MSEMNFEKYYDKGNTGLINLGNTCFLNACVQALSHTYELSEILDSPKIQNLLKKDIIDYVMFVEWNDLRKVMWSQNSTVSPNKFVHNVQQIAKEKHRDIFTGWTQNDMPEFLMFIIECIHNSISRSVNIKIAGSPENNVDQLAIKCYQMIKEEYFREYSEIMELFYGIQVTEILSLNKKKSLSVRPENFFILNLPILDRPCSLYDCLDMYIHPELLSNENSWQNDVSGKRENVYRRTLFWNFPKILIITLKRFSSDGTTKIEELVDFPINEFNLSKYTNGYNAQQNIYELYAVCNHYGNVYMGHYTTYIKNAKGEWMHYNDEQIEPIETISHIVSSTAYCLFYRKK